MVKLEGNPVKIVTGEHTCDPATVDPLMHLCLAFASCIAKWLRKHYMCRGITEPLYNVSISMNFEQLYEESITIEFSTTYDNYDNAVNVVKNLSEECYIGKIVKLKKTYTVRCDMYKHSIVVL